MLDSPGYILNSWNLRTKVGNVVLTLFQEFTSGQCSYSHRELAVSVGSCVLTRFQEFKCSIVEGS